MARNRDPFTQALSSLRERLHAGVLSPGRPVIVQDEARRLNLSTTPVREALARLSGEGLVERAPSGGYVAVRLDAAAARDRYAMHGHYVRIAVEMNLRALGPLRLPAPAFDAGRPALAANRLFELLVCSAGNLTLSEAWRRVSRQLDLLRRLESRLFEDLAEEAAGLHTTWAAGAGAEFAAAAARYHERRIDAAAALAALAMRCARPDAGAAAVTTQAP